MSIRLYNNSGGYIDLNAGGDGTAANTFTLPAETGTLLTSATSASSIPGYGNQITEADQWRLSTTVSKTNGGFIDTGWERVDTDYDYIGTGMSESSGVFTFPSTGIWLIISQTTGYASSSGTFVGHRVFVSTDGGSSFNTRASGWSGNYTSNGYWYTCLHTMLDVTNSSNFQIKFECSTNAGTISFDGSTSQTLSGVNFIRLGNT